MDWNTLLLWIACPSCFISLFAAMRGSPRLRGWIFVCAMILAIGGSVFLRSPDHAGYVTGGLWAVFVLAPVLLQRGAQRWTIRQNYQRASRFARLAGLLHPFDGVPEQTRFLHAMALAERGSTAEAISILHRLEQTAPVRTARIAAVHARRLGNDWPGLLQWLGEHLPENKLLREPGLLPMYVRALGETGQLPAMLQTTWASRLPLHPQLAFYRNMCRLFCFAFCGQSGQVADAFATVLRQVPIKAQHYWVATAAYAAGDPSQAQALLDALEPVAGPELRINIRNRRENPPTIADLVLSDSDRVLLQQLDLQQEHEQRFAPALVRHRRPWMTYALIAANVVVFAIEWAQGASAGNWIDGGTMSDQVLHRLGAMQPDVLQTHEYFRLLAANFLHFGYAHILMNMLALWILGPFVEFALGRSVYAIFYLTSGVCVMLTVLFLQVHNWMEPQMLVGASGAIMAIIGATAAILLRGWYREKATAALRRLAGVGAMLMLQVTFDHFTPQVSGAAHIAGMVWGFVLASLIPHKGREETFMLSNRSAGRSVY